MNGMQWQAMYNLNEETFTNQLFFSLWTADGAEDNKSRARFGHKLFHDNVWLLILAILYFFFFM